MGHHHGLLSVPRILMFAKFRVNIYINSQMKLRERCGVMADVIHPPSRAKIPSIPKIANLLKVSSLLDKQRGFRKIEIKIFLHTDRHNCLDTCALFYDVNPYCALEWYNFIC